MPTAVNGSPRANKWDENPSSSAIFSAMGKPSPDLEFRVRYS